jgi:hypothetical protein
MGFPLQCVGEFVLDEVHVMYLLVSVVLLCLWWSNIFVASRVNISVGGNLESVLLDE